MYSSSSQGFRNYLVMKAMSEGFSTSCLISFQWLWKNATDRLSGPEDLEAVIEKTACLHSSKESGAINGP